MTTAADDGDSYALPRRHRPGTSVLAYHADTRPRHGIHPGPAADRLAAGTWRPVALSGVIAPIAWVLMSMPDGNCAEGAGDTIRAAMADARRRWRKWRRANPSPLAAMHRDYRQRRKARARKGRR